jgi:peptidoglycan-N-acetylglucosamine deacetylase
MRTPYRWLSLLVLIGVTLMLLPPRAHAVRPYTITGGALEKRPMPAGRRATAFAWPDGMRAAISLSFDDARESQLDEGLPVLAETNTKVTFYLTANNLGARAADWRKAAAAGHELGNHSMTHPCSGNFAWSRDRALEDFTLDQIRSELNAANRAIEDATGVRPVTFAYPCGQAFVGRGAGVMSYVPLVSDTFLAGRLWRGEAPNDPGFVDLAQVLGYPMDDVDFSELEPVVSDAITRGQWLVLAGHDIGSKPGPQVTRIATLRALAEYARAPGRGVWVDTIANVAAYIKRAGARLPPATIVAPSSAASPT